MPWQVYTHARLGETLRATERAWRRAGIVVGRGNGKTDGVLAPYILDSIVEGVGVLGLAQNLDVAMDTFNTVLGVVEADPFLSKRIPPRGVYRGKGQARLQLRHPVTHRVATYRLSVTAKGCRGPRAPRIAADESAYIDNKVMSAARYVQNGSGMADRQQVLAVCTAGDDARDDKGELQWFARWRAAHLAATDPRLLWLEWSIPEDGDPADRALWPIAVPALGHTITEAEIEDNLDDPDFVREAMSRWGVTLRSIIEPEAWGARRLTVDQVQQLDQQRPPIVGLAVAVERDDRRTALVASYVTEHGMAVKVLDEREGRSWAVAVAREWQDRTRLPIALDEYGPAGPLRDDLEAAGVGVEVVNTNDYAKACASLLNEVRHGGVAHFGQPGLDAAAAQARRRFLGDRWVWQRDVSDVAALEGATLALIRARHAAPRAVVR